MTPDYFRTLARYNAWANRRLYDACAKLPDGERKRDRRSFFRSIHNTLNHLLVGDRIWLARLEGKDHGIKSLDQVLYDDFGRLRQAREAEDERITLWMDGLDERRLAGTLRYRSMSDGRSSETALPFVLGHVFNHQTHHRGQVHGMLSQTEVAPPPLDLLYYVRDAG